MARRKRVIRAAKDADSLDLPVAREEVKEYLETCKFLDRQTSETLIELLEDQEYDCNGAG